MNEPADYVEEDDIEETLTFFEKLKRIWEVSKWLRAVFMACKLLFIGSTTAVVVGQVTDTNPIRDAAVEVGVLGEKPPLTIDELWVQVMALEEEIERLKLPHEHDYPDTEVIVGPAGKDGKDGKDGQPGIAGKDGKDGINGIDGVAGIDDALNRHKLDDH